MGITPGNRHIAMYITLGHGHITLGHGHITPGHGHMLLQVMVITLYMEILCEVTQAPREEDR